MNIDTLLEAARYVEWRDEHGASADKLEISLERDADERLWNGDHAPHVPPTGAPLPSPSPSPAQRPTNGTCDVRPGGRAHASAVAAAPPSTPHRHGASQGPGGAVAAVPPPGSAGSTPGPNQSKLTHDHKRFAPTQQPLSAGANAVPRSGPAGRLAQQQQTNVTTAVTVSPSQPPPAEAPIPSPVNARFTNPGRVLLHHHQNHQQHQQQQSTLLLPAAAFKEPSLSAGSGSESPGRGFAQVTGLGSASPGQAGVTGQSAQPAPLPPVAPGKAAQASADELFPADQKRRPGGAGTREVHNKLEKSRRAHLKECFDALKKIIPRMEEKKTSNLTILRGALRYIQVLKRKEKEFEHEMERLAREKISSQQRLADLRNELSESLDAAHIEGLLHQALSRGPTPRPGQSNSRAAAAAADDDEEYDEQQEEDDDATSTASEGEENMDEELENSGPVPPSETPAWFQKTPSQHAPSSQPLVQNATMQAFPPNVKVQAFAQSSAWQAVAHGAKGPASQQSTTVQVFSQAFPPSVPAQASPQASQNATPPRAAVRTLSPNATVQVLSQLASPLQVACRPAPPRKAPRQTPVSAPGRHAGAPHSSAAQATVGGSGVPLGGSSQQPPRPPKPASVVGALVPKQHGATLPNHFHAVTVTSMSSVRAAAGPGPQPGVAQHVLTLPLARDKAGAATALGLAVAPQRAVASGQTSVIRTPLGHALHVLRPVNTDAGGKAGPPPASSVCPSSSAKAAGGRPVSWRQLRCWSLGRAVWPSRAWLRPSPPPPPRATSAPPPPTQRRPPATPFLPGSSPSRPRPPRGRCSEARRPL